MKAAITISRQVLQYNAQNGTDLPAIEVTTEKGTIMASEVVVPLVGKFTTKGDDRLHGTAKVWFETDTSIIRVVE